MGTKETPSGPRNASLPRYPETRNRRASGSPRRSPRTQCVCIHENFCRRDAPAPTAVAARADPARAQTARHCHLVGAAGRSDAARRAQSANRAAELSLPRAAGAASKNARPSRSPRGRGSGAGLGGGARRRRSRGLATGSSQWERESARACARCRRERPSCEGRPPSAGDGAGRGGSRAGVRLRAREPPTAEGTDQGLKIAECFKIGLSHWPAPKQ